MEGLETTEIMNLDPRSSNDCVKQPVHRLLLSNSLRAVVTGPARTFPNKYAPYAITVNRTSIAVMAHLCGVFSSA
jgi:hypothetical protein